MNTKQLQDRQRRLEQARKEMNSYHLQLLKRHPIEEECRELEEDLLLPLRRINPLYFPEINGSVGLHMQEQATKRMAQEPIHYWLIKWKKLTSGLTFDQLSYDRV